MGPGFFMSAYMSWYLSYSWSNIATCRCFFQWGLTPQFWWMIAGLPEGPWQIHFIIIFPRGKCRSFNISNCRWCWHNKLKCHVNLTWNKYFMVKSQSEFLLVQLKISKVLLDFWFGWQLNKLLSNSISNNFCTIINFTRKIVSLYCQAITCINNTG